MDEDVGSAKVKIVILSKEFLKEQRVQVECYHCPKEDKRKGIAIIKVYKVKAKKRGKILEYIKRERSSKNFNHLSGENWLCNKCDKFRCRKCKILLSNTFKCSCGLTHGRYTEKSLPFCEECYNPKK